MRIMEKMAGILPLAPGMRILDLGCGTGISSILLSLALVRGMPIGVAYAIWVALGVASVAIIGAVFLGDKLTEVQIFGVVLVIGGVVSLELGGNINDCRVVVCAVD